MQNHRPVQLVESHLDIPAAVDILVVVGILVAVADSQVVRHSTVDLDLSDNSGKWNRYMSKL